MHRLANRFLSFTILAAVLVGAAGSASAQTFDQLRALVELNVPHPQGLLHQLDVAENSYDSENIATAIHQLHGLEYAIDGRVGHGINSPTADALISFTESIVDALAAGPKDWWCDYDGDGYTWYWGMSCLAPSPYCSSAGPGLGYDCDDTNPDWSC